LKEEKKKKKIQRQFPSSSSSSFLVDFIFSSSYESGKKARYVQVDVCTRAK